MVLQIACRIVLGIFLPLVIVGTPAWAKNDNPNLLPLGEDEALSANTGIARSGSPANTYYNPAGIADIRERRLTVTGSTYAVLKASFDNGPDTEPIEFSSFSAVPNMIATSKEVRGWVVSYGIFSPVVLSIDVKNTINHPLGDMRLNINSREEEQYLGVGTGRKLENQNWSVGASLFGHRSFASEFVSLNLGPNATSHIVQSKRTHVEVFSLLAVLGLQHKWNSQFQWGMRLSSPNITLSNNAEVYVEQITANGVTVDKSLEDKRYKNANYKMPLSLGLGMSWQALPKHGWLLDLNVQSAEEYNTIPGSSANMHIELGTTLTAQLGYSYQLKDDKKLLFGLNWSPSAVRKEVNAEGSEDPQQNYLGVTSGFYSIEDNVRTGVGLFYLRSRTDRDFFGGEPDNQTSLAVYGLSVSTSIRY